jgi:hypothetical protein
MLYWAETAIIACWTMLRLAQLDASERGKISVNGHERPATRLGLVGFFAGHASAFIVVHAIFLFAFFSSEWFKKVHGVGDFFYELWGASYIWTALVFLMIASGFSFFIWSRTPRAPLAPGADGPVGAIVGGLYTRIVVMQLAIIFGAMFANMFGSTAPLVIVIVLKTLIDLGAYRGIPIKQTGSYSSNGTKIEM